MSYLNNSEWSTKHKHFTIILATLIATIIEAALKETGGFPRVALDILMILRCLRILRICNSIQRFRIILVTIKNILPSLGTYCVVIVCIYTVYAIIGMECFQGYVKDIGKGMNFYFRPTFSNFSMKDFLYIDVMNTG